MNRPSEPPKRDALRERLIGAGERSFRKSYYLGLRKRLDQLERFRALLDHTNDLILLVELASHCIIDANASACRQLRYPDRELFGRSIEEVVDLERLEWPEASGEAADCRTVATVLRRRDGVEIPAELILCLDEFAGSTYLVVVARDITERLQAGEILRKSELEKALILESTEELVVYHDREMRIVWANRACGRSLNLPHEQLAGRRCWELWHHRTTPCTSCPVIKALKTGQPHKAEVTGPDGRVWLIRGYPARSVSGEVEGVVELCLDITDRKRAEEALRESDRIKSEFISTAAHEFRTPLTSILGFSRVLLEQENLPPEDRREFLTYINRKAEALADIVTDLLDIARIESGQGLALNRAESTVGEIVAQLAPLVMSEKHPERYEIACADEQTRLWVDKAKIAQVFENLLSNALKYSPPGSPIRIAGEVDDGQYRFTVTDQGVGMTAEQVARVFDKFYRVDASNTAIAGLGLGMSIVRNIVEVHDGRIWVESEPGRGTAVHFALPLYDAAEAKQ